MTSPSRREQLSDRLAESTFVKNVVGPKILKPVADWYDDKLENDVEVENVEVEKVTEPSTNAPTPDVEMSPSLASAKSAEAFFAGPESDTTAPTITKSIPAAEPQDALSDAGHPVEPGRLERAKAIALRVKARVKEHNLNVVAAGIAFWTLLAIPAILTAVVSIYGLIASPDDVESQIEDVLSGASPEVQSIIGEQLAAVAGGSNSGLAVGAAAGVLLAMWTASGAVAKLIATLNVIFGVSEDRRFFHLRGLALAITGGAVVVIVGAAFLLAALPAVLDKAGLGGLAQWLFNIGRFPAMLTVMAVALAILYWAGPNRSRPYRVLTWGAAWATVLWLTMSGLFTVYTASFATYNETYGSLGAMVVLLLWLFLTAFTILVGAEIDAARETLAAD